MRHSELFQMRFGVRDRPINFLDAADNIGGRIIQQQQLLELWLPMFPAYMQWQWFRVRIALLPGPRLASALISLASQ